MPMNIKSNSFTVSEINQALIDLGFYSYEDLRLDWVNNFLTISGFADYYEIGVNMAFNLLSIACEK